MTLVLLSEKEVELSDGSRCPVVTFYDSLTSVHKEMCEDKIFFDKDLSKIAVVAVTIFVSAIILAAIGIGIVITVHLWKRYFREYEGETEERRRLRQENGTVHAIA